MQVFLKYGFTFILLEQVHIHFENDVIYGRPLRLERI
jgi:hypothetical protein